MGGTISTQPKEVLPQRPKDRDFLLVRAIELTVIVLVSIESGEKFFVDNESEADKDLQCRL